MSRPHSRQVLNPTARPLSHGRLNFTMASLDTCQKLRFEQFDGTGPRGGKARFELATCEACARSCQRRVGDSRLSRPHNRPHGLRAEFGDMGPCPKRRTRSHEETALLRIALDLDATRGVSLSTVVDLGVTVPLQEFAQRCWDACAHGFPMLAYASAVAADGFCGESEEDDCGMVNGRLCPSDSSRVNVYGMPSEVAWMIRRVMPQAPKLPDGGP